ncbi:MAG: hypothetical protein M1834_007635 [Cirrosporium novae-zelandiae]|nr:MAG: hypothetical protein M1834_007635 [Cirrosporium novae-zelandiae]
MSNRRRPSYTIQDNGQPWAAIDEYVFSNLHPHSRPNNSALTQTLEASKQGGLPPIFSSRIFGKFLALQCRLAQAKHALEVGTLGGYSAVWLATQNPGLRVSTIEYDAHHAEVARKNIEEAGVSDRVTVYVGVGVEVLPQLFAKIEEGSLERIGFTFIDADKINNYTYFDWAVKMSRSGACIIVDNMLARGQLLNSEARGDGHVQGARKLIEEAGKDDRVESLVMQMVGERGYDGFFMAVVL